MKERTSAIRFGMIGTMFFSSFLMTVLTGILEKWYADQMIVYVLLEILFFALFLYALEYNRLHKKMVQGKAENYRRLCVIFCGCCICNVIFLFLPSYSCPVAVLAFFIAAETNLYIGMCMGTFLNLLLVLADAGSIQEMACYMLLSLFGCILSSAIKEKKNRWYLVPLFLCVHLLCPPLLQYASDGTVTSEIFLVGAIDGVICSIVILLFYDKIFNGDAKKEQKLYDTIIQDDYSLVQEIREYSLIDFHHAVKVSNIAAECAVLLGADERTVRAAGLYYRVGKLEGEPFVENGVSVAVNHFFPDAVTEILFEYNGELQPPSTIESAIVHIVDCVVTKYELLDQDMLSNTWNQDMIIYQTLNEKSASGIYDHCGLSMNQFLKIREYLVKKEGLL